MEVYYTTYYIHKTVNHPHQNVIDPNTHANTRTIEKAYRVIK